MSCVNPLKLTDANCPSLIMLRRQVVCSLVSLHHFKMIPGCTCRFISDLYIISHFHRKKTYMCSTSSVDVCPIFAQRVPKSGNYTKKPEVNSSVFLILHAIVFMCFVYRISNLSAISVRHFCHKFLYHRVSDVCILV